MILRRITSRNAIVTIATLTFAVLAILSLPLTVEPFNLLTPESQAKFRLQLNESEAPTSPIIADGFITLTGKGGLSAGNPLTLSVTLYLNQTYWSNHKPSKIVFRPHGAYYWPVTTDERGFPLFVNVTLADRGVKWVGEERVVYYQGDNWGSNIILDDALSIRSPNFIHIGTEDVTVASRTNAILTSLTLAFLAFAVLDFRTKENEDYKKN